MVSMPATIVHIGGCLTIKPGEWEREIGVNLTGAFHLAQAVTQHLVKNEAPGRVVFIGGWAAHAPTSLLRGEGRPAHVL
jgi:glucose 1-dehydrogenase